MPELASEFRRVKPVMRIGAPNVIAVPDTRQAARGVVVILVGIDHLVYSVYITEDWAPEVHPRDDVGTADGE